MTRRRVEIAVLAFGALFVAYLLYSFRPGRRPSALSPRGAVSEVPPPAEAGQATTVLKGFDYTETVHGRPLFHIQSERTVGFGPAAGLLPNLYALEKVTLTVYPETGSPVTVHSDRATYDHRTNAARLNGNVRWVDGRGALGETEEVEFQPSARLLVAARPLRVTRGTFALEAPSGVYDVRRRELRLAGPVHGAGTGEGTGGLSRLSANSAAYRRDEALVELAGSVSGESAAGNHIEADRLVLKTREEGNGFDWARAEGHVRGTLQAGALPGSNPPGGRKGTQSYSGDRAGLLFAADGSVRSLSLAGAPAAVDEAVLPGVSPAPGRKLRADSIEVALEGGRAKTARAQGSVRIESEGNRGESDQATLALSPSGEVQTLELAGSVRIEGEGRSGRADRAVEVADRGLWILTGAPGRSATVEGDGSRVSAARIEIDQRRKGLRADGDSRALLTPRKTGDRPATPVGDSSRPIFAKAVRMTFDDTTRVATFSGGATLWQDASSVFGSDITLNDHERTLVAVGNTRTVFSPARESSGKAVAERKDRSPSVITAHRLVYRESAAPGIRETPSTSGGGAPSTAVFEVSVVATSGTWRATGEKATAWIGPDRKLERVEMAGNVAFLDSKEGRSGQGEKITDWPGEGRTVLEGSPAWVLDRDGNRITGATLTIGKRGGSVEVTAPEGGRTQTIHKTRGR